MRVKRSLFVAGHLACALAAVSCAPTAQGSSVDYGSRAVVGRWQDEQDPVEADAATSETDSAAAPSGKVSPAPSNTAGSNASDPPSARPTVQDAGAAGSGGAAAQADAGTPATPAAPEPPTRVTSLSFEVTTSAAGGRYQPKNIGAIWIEDQNGKLVKSLEVWAATRRRYLTGYVAALAGASIDVTTSATLARHRAHTLSWNLTDRSGNAVAQGSYRLKMELTDGNQTGKSTAIAFDTTQGPVTLSPTDAPSFGAMKVQLK